jgi:glycosyltransferase involved in cell wall biosynthesis
MSLPLTVGIAFHDEEPRLERAIRSVLAQSYGDFELLLVDDGSTDRSLEIAQSFTDRRIIVTSDGRRRHLAARLNDIAQRARGDRIARMDGDDVSHPERLRLQMDHLDRVPDCTAVGTWTALIDDDDETFGVFEASGLRPGDVPDAPPIPHATMMARAEWLRRYPYDTSLRRAEDRDLWARVAGASRIDAIADVLYLVHVSAARPTFIADYLQGQADLRRVLFRYGRRTPLLTAGRVASSLAKSGVMVVADAIGASARLVRRRGRAPTDREMERVREAVSASNASRGSESRR